MESNKAYELYKQTNDEAYIKIINTNAHGLERKYMHEGSVKGCVYVKDDQGIDRDVATGITYA